MSQLLLPAGSFQSGLAAFEGGADGIYLGFTSLSARKDAKNFTFEQFSKITSYAKAHRKEVVVALNTLMTDQELPQALQLAKQADFIGCDGVIVQDIGLAKLLRSRFPSLPLHASTQMAVHTIEGVKTLQRAGFTQVVLSRELTVEEIRKIREACPAIKLEVFIHGALCYGFSGLCMASHKICDRSANKGACAQICRSYFDLKTDPLKPEFLSPHAERERAWFFSMSDLDGTRSIKQLQEMGIDTLKIEGRMKSPAYTYSTAQYYRALLDGEGDPAGLKKQMLTTFSRRTTGGWLSSYNRETESFTPRKETLGSTDYPGHTGIPVGKVEEITPWGALVQLKEDIALRDGLAYFTPGEREPVESVQFGLSGMKNAYRKPIAKAEAGERVLISIPSKEHPVNENTVLFMISRHDQNMPTYGKDLKPYAVPLDMTVTLKKDSMSVSAHLPFINKKVQKIYPLKIERARTAQDPESMLQKSFSLSDTSLFCLRALTVQNSTEQDLENLFIPISRINIYRRDWYNTLDTLASRYLRKPEKLPETSKKYQSELLPLRNMLSDSDKIPWVNLNLLAQAEHPEQYLPSAMGKLYLPLPPVTFNEEKLIEDLNTVVEKIKDAGKIETLRVGLNNVAHVGWAEAHPDIKVFADIYLYLANSESAKTLIAQLKNCVAGYLWLETDEYDKESWPFEPTPVESGFNIPLFISRSCFRHDSLKLSCEQCPHKGFWYVTLPDAKYRVMVKDCITTVIEA